MSLGDAPSSERVSRRLVSGNYFEVVGARPARADSFVPDEDATPGTHPVVVLRHRFWTDRFKADPAIVGQTIRLNNLPYTVVGVAEAGFTGTTFLGDRLLGADGDGRVGPRERGITPQQSAAVELRSGSRSRYSSDFGFSLGS